LPFCNVHLFFHSNTGRKKGKKAPIKLKPARGH
jgi:hypothetical protein